MRAGPFPPQVQQGTILRYRKNPTTEQRVKLDALRDRNGLSRELQLYGIEWSCHQHIAIEIKHMSHGIGNGRTAVEQDPASFAVKRSQVEDIFLTDGAKEGCHKEEMISIGQEIRPAVGPFVPAYIESRDTLRCSTQSRNTLDFATDSGEDDYIRAAPTRAPARVSVAQRLRRPSRHRDAFQFSLCKEAQIAAVWRPKREGGILGTGQRASRKRI